MSIGERLEYGAQVGADRWREGMRSVSFAGLAVAILLLAAGIAGSLLVHAAVGIPLIVISLVVLVKSGFTPVDTSFGD